MTKRPTPQRHIGLRFLIVFLLPVAICLGDVHLPAIFGNQMLLQPDTKIPIWGCADAGKAVTVTLGTAPPKSPPMPTENGGSIWIPWQLRPLPSPCP